MTESARGVRQVPWSPARFRCKAPRSDEGGFMNQYAAPRSERR